MPRTLRLSRRTAWAWLLFAASVGAYGVVWRLLQHQPFYVAVPHPNSFDLKVYRAAGRAVLHGYRLYDTPLYHRLGFTYPPIAALLFAPGALLPERLDEVLVAGLNLAILVAVIRLTPRLARAPGRSSSRGRRRAASWGWGTVASVSALVLWCEPVTTAIGYGQIDLLITLLLVADLARAPGSRGRGMGVGLAAGLKLTPLLFIPYLLLARDRRGAATAAGSFLATVAAGFVLLPADSARFWGGTFLRSSRVGDVAAPINQSLWGAIARALHTIHPGAGVAAVVAAAGVAGVLVAVLAARRGEDGVGFAVCALTSLLVSPISWTHHWVLAIPALIELWRWGRRRRLRSVQVTAALLGLAAAAYLPELLGTRQGADPGPLELGCDAYVILGVVVVTAVGFALRRGPVPSRAGGVDAPPLSPQSAVAMCRRSMNRGGRIRIG